VLGLPIGGFIGWLTQMSDHAGDRRFGAFSLVLSLLSVVFGHALIRSPRPVVRAASLALSAGWAVAAIIVFVMADFIADKLWGAGLTGFVAVATAAVAILGHRGTSDGQSVEPGC
jgi:hypothetical protein